MIKALIVVVVALALGAPAMAAQINIPAIGVRTSVTANLNAGPAWWPDTGRPGGGNTIAIAGHRTTHTRPFHGTCWVNLGDSYTSGGRTWRAPDSKDASGDPRAMNTRPDTPLGLKPKDLVGIPWRVAFSLQNDGWWLRSDVIWSKQNPMPESVTDRPTRSHEYIFLLTKEARYWWDIEAVREPHSPDERKVTTVKAGDGSIQHRDGERWPNSGRNIRTVWSIAAQPFPGAHFATFPEELARRAIFAGCPMKVCQECGKPSERIVERELVDVEGWAPVKKLDHSQGAAEHGNGRFGDPVTQTLGWTDCGHNSWRPGVVLDPFMAFNYSPS